MNLLVYQFLALLVHSSLSQVTQIAAGFEYVTCTSSLKLVSKSTSYRLHSHSVSYGEGSGQQSVTAFADSDSNSYWTIRAAYCLSPCPCLRGESILCGSTIRLTHLNTQKLLHSHNHVSPLTRQQEVSAYEGEDDGDNWEVQCLNSKQTHWLREEPVSLMHKVTGVFLGVSPQATYGQPIPGQLEVSGMKSKSANTVWLAQEGIYFKALEAK